VHLLVLFTSNLSMLYKVKDHTEHSTQCEHHVEFLNVKAGGT